MAINLALKYSDKVSERFKKSSVTAGVSNQDYDFDGVKSVVVYSVDTAPLGDYTRSGTLRYGTPAELGDTTQVLTMTQDKAFTYTIDKGNQKEQFNIKGAAKSLRRQIDEVVVPTMDKYRLEVWSKNAGNIKATNAPVANTIVSLIMDGTATLDNALVPESGRTLFVTASGYKLLKQNPDFLNIDDLGKEALVKGQVGEIDGMRVIKVPDSYLPEGVRWLITHKSAIMGPAKLLDYKIHKDPPGINGDLVEGRIIHDAFVLEAKANAVYAAVDGNNKTKTPVITVDTTNSLFNIATNTATATIFYTVDGTDPRYNNAPVTYTSDVNYSGFAPGNHTIYAYASDLDNNIYASDLANATFTVAAT